MKSVSALLGVLLLAGTGAQRLPAPRPASSAAVPQPKATYPFQNPDLSIDQRVDDLVGRLTLPEKVSQMINASPAIDRLVIPAYNWCN